MMAYAALRRFGRSEMGAIGLASAGTASEADSACPVWRVEGPQEIRAGHPYFGRELLHARRSDNFAKRDLKRNLFVDRAE